MLDDIIEGRADRKTLELLEETAKAVQLGSLCALGKTAPNPVLSTLRFFREEYEAHVFKKICPVGECKALARPEILASKCKGCTACARKCPGRRDHRQSQGSPRDRRGQVHQVRRLQGGLQIRCGDRPVTKTTFWSYQIK